MKQEYDVKELQLEEINAATISSYKEKIEALECEECKLQTNNAQLSESLAHANAELEKKGKLQEELHTCVTANAKLADDIEALKFEEGKLQAKNAKLAKGLADANAKLKEKGKLQEELHKYQTANVKLAQNLAYTKVQLGKLTNISSQNENWTSTPLFSTFLKRDCTRTCHNINIGDRSRANLGTGNWTVQEATNNSKIVTVCQLIGGAEDVKFASKVDILTAHKSMRLHSDAWKKNPGESVPMIEPTMVWDAYDLSGLNAPNGKVQIREFTIRFNDLPQMIAALLWMLGGGHDYEIVKEFLAGPEGRFWRKEETLPPHPMERDIEYDMDIDGDELVLMRAPPLSKGEEEEEYGEVAYESQLY